MNASHHLGRRSINVEDKEREQVKRMMNGQESGQTGRNVLDHYTYEEKRKNWLGLGGIYPLVRFVNQAPANERESTKRRRLVKYRQGNSNGRVMTLSLS